MAAKSGERNTVRLFVVVFLVCFAGFLLCDGGAGAPGVCLILSLLLLLLFPGFVPALKLREKLELGVLELFPLSVCLSLGQAAVVLLVFEWLGLSVLSSRWVLMLLPLGWWVWAECGGRAGFTFSSEGDFPPPDLSRRGRAMVNLVLLAAVVAVSALLLVTGAPLQWETDSVAHVTAIGGVIEEDSVFPTAQPYGPGVLESPDPRFGVFHAVCALLALSSGAEIQTLWSLLPGLFAPLLMLALFSAARAITGSTRVALLASILFPVCYGGVQNWGLLTLGYPNRVSMVMYFVYLGLFFRYLKTGRNWLLFLVSLLAAAAATIHVYHFVEFVFVMLCLFLVELAANRGKLSQMAERLALGVGVTVAFALPFILYRFLASYSTANQYNMGIHGSLYLSGEIYILDPFAVYGLIGLAGVVSVLLLPYFISGARRNVSHAFVVAATAGPLLLVFNPPLLSAASSVLSYLASRLVWAIPYALALGIFVSEFPVSFKRSSRRVKTLLVLAMLLVVWSIGGTLAQRVDFFKYALAQGERRFPEDLAAISEEVGLLDSEIEGRRMFLSDPVTAYAIPAFTRHFVTATPLAHSAPADSFPVSRVRDAVDVLNPNVGLARTLDILRDYGVEYVVVNTGFPEKLSAFEYEIRPDMQERALAKMLANPAVFEKVLVEESLHVFRVKGTDAAELSAEEKDLLNEEQVYDIASESIARFSDLFSLESVEIVPHAAAPGDSLRIDCLWKCLAPLPREEVYRLFVRLETDFPKGALYWDRMEKPYRKLLEREVGKTFRFRQDVDPHSFRRPLHLWKAGEMVRESVVVIVPDNVWSGRYAVQMNLRSISGGIKFSLSDYFVDRDYYSGFQVGAVDIR